MRVSPDGREVAAMVERLPTGRRFVLGLSGAPGSGKSTLAAALAAAYGAPVVPMDGFHRTEADLSVAGLLATKGAPDTFDAEAYAALLARLRLGEAVRAPAFDHGRPDPLPDRIEVAAGAGLVVTEGNYLLLDQPRWRAVRRQLDRVWHVTTASALRRQRLVARHVASGRPAADARARVDVVDEPNAAVVEAAASAADQVLDLTDWAGRLGTG